MSNIINLEKYRKSAHAVTKRKGVPESMFFDQEDEEALYLRDILNKLTSKSLDDPDYFY